MKKKILVGILVVVLLAAIVASFQLGNTENIKVGLLAPLTGPIPTIGNDVKNGILVAADEINKAGGINGKKIDLIIEDSKCDASAGLSAFKKLVEVDNVKAMLGITCSSVAFTTQELSNSGKLPTIHALVSGWKNNQTGGYIFNIWPGAMYETPFDANYIYNKLGWKKMAIIYVNNDFGKAFQTSFKSSFEALGGSIAVSEAHEAKETDFKTILTKIKSAKPDGIYLVSLEIPAISLVRQAVELGFDPNKIFAVGGIVGHNFLDSTKGEADGIIVNRIIDINSQEYKTLSEKSAKLFGQEIETTAGLTGYDSVYILSAGLKDGGEDAEKIRDAIQKIKYAGLSGKIELDQFGKLKEKQDFFVYSIENGKLDGTIK